MMRLEIREYDAQGEPLGGETAIYLYDADGTLIDLCCFMSDDDTDEDMRRLGYQPVDEKYPHESIDGLPEETVWCEPAPRDAQA